MIIDFHTHVFPDKIAAGAIEGMSKETGILNYLYGTRDELVASMGRAGVDISVLLPVVTKPKQFKTVNDYAEGIAHTYDNGSRLIAFGGVHPDSPNLREEIKELRSRGFKGIKIHPDYQQCDIDDPRNLKLIEYANEEGLIVVAHAGLDMAFPRHVHCTPPLALNMLKAVKPEKFVLAHMGGLYYFDEVEELLCNENVYFDTAYFIGKTNPRQITRIMRKHGIDRILFATDSPWGDQVANVKMMDTFELTPEEMEKVMYKNAAKLLDLEVE